MSIIGENYYREPVKVVIINTQYVETDATSFKSVVQNLTGKDSVIPEIVKSSSKKNLQRRSLATVVQGGVGGGGGGGNNYNEKGVMGRGMSFKSLDRGMSFKDLDRLLLEFPSMDELYRLCSD